MECSDVVDVGVGTTDGGKGYGDGGEGSFIFYLPGW